MDRPHRHLAIAVASTAFFTALAAIFPNMSRVVTIPLAVVSGIAIIVLWWPDLRNLTKVRRTRMGASLIAIGGTGIIICTLVLLGGILLYQGPSGTGLSDEQKILYRTTVLRVSAGLSNFVADQQRIEPVTDQKNMDESVKKFQEWTQNMLADYQSRFGQDMAYIAMTSSRLGFIDDHMALLMNRPTNFGGMQMVSSKLAQISISLSAQ